MKKFPSWTIMMIAPLLATAGGMAIAAQDKYTVQVPGGLAFSEFKGYEDWQSVAVSKTESAIAVILANPVMIEAYRAGIPDNGKPFPKARRSRKSIGSRQRARTLPLRQPCRANS